MTRTSIVAVALLGFAGSVYAAPQAPHDFAHGVTCNSCHIPYAGLTDPSHWFTGTGEQGATSLTVAGATWAPNQWVGGVVTFTSGANQYKHRLITANDATSVSWAASDPLTPAAGVTFQINKVAYDDIELKCKACHNPTGPVPGSVGLHFIGSGGAIGCGKCHEPHNIEPSSGWSGGTPAGGGLVRAEIRLPTGGTAPVSYDPAGGPGRFVTPSGNGVCQVCHTRTAYYRSDGTLQTHQVGASCASCHGHEAGFGGGATGSAHFDATAAAWSDHGWSQGCLRCHTRGGFKDYIGEADGTPNYLSGSFNSNATSSAFGPLDCTVCHNAVSDPNSGTLTSILFPSLKQVSTDHVTALCGQCHQARESTASLDSKMTSNVATTSKGLGIVSSSANAAGTATTLVRTGSTWGVDAYKGYTLLFTVGTHQDTKVTVTGNTATVLTFSPAIAGTTVSGEAFTMWPTATAGGSTTALSDTNRAWTANQWTNFNIYFQTGVNAGLYRRITANTATALTLSGALPAAPAAGDCYQIVPAEDTAVLDAQLASSNSFTNSHYLGAAATVFGGDAAGMYQYPASASGYPAYTGTNYHGVTARSCASCHNPHTLQITVNVSTCGRCHFNDDGSPVASMAELEEARQFGFEGDIDGDGVPSSLKLEIANLTSRLLQTAVAYATNITGHRLCYNPDVYSYVWEDTNGDGVCGNTGDTGFRWFTPRLLRAMYNVHFYFKAPGAWAHNPRYAIEVLYDGIVDLNAGLAARGFAPVSFTGFRTFAGHFGAASAEFPAGGEQFRDWDASVVSNSCSQCHAGERGLENYLANPWTTITNRPVTGMQCTTCHDPLATDQDMRRIRTIAGVRFPPRSSNGAGGQQAPIVRVAADFLDPGDMVCATCHSGRESKASIDYRTTGVADTSYTLTFTNPHYLGAAAIMLGTDAKMTYEYAGKTYAGTKVHHGARASCLDCHDPRASRHTFEVADAVSTCQSSGCHGTTNYATYKSVAHDGGLSFDGHAPGETLGAQVQHLSAMLLARIQAYAAAPNAGGAICYDGSRNPYFFFDSNGNGACDPTDTTSYNHFNPVLLRAAFNYQWSQKEPGAWAHNFDYMAQILYDSIESLGGDVTGLVRP